MTVLEARSACEQAGMPVRVAARAASTVMKFGFAPELQPHVLETIIETWKQENDPDRV